MAETKEAVAKVKKYRMNARAAYQYPDAVTLVPSDLTQRVGGNTQSVSVAMGTKALTRELPATKERPKTTITVQPATQEQLKYLYEIEQHPFIEMYEE